MEFNITVKNGQIEVGEAAIQIIKAAKEADLEKKRRDIQLEGFKEALKQAMEANSIKKFENDDVAVTYIAPTKRRSVDTAAMKEQGIYDSFIKEIPVKASVKVSFKE